MMTKLNSILLTVFGVLLIGCNTLNPINSEEEKPILTLNPITEGTNYHHFQRRENHQIYNLPDAKSFTMATHPNQLTDARGLAYQNILTNRLWKYSIREYYLNGNGIVFITDLQAIDTTQFRDFVRDDFCPLVNDLAQSFGNNRRVIMLDKNARQGRYMDYSFELCKQVAVMAITDANRVIFPRIMAF